MTTKIFNWLKSLFVIALIMTMSLAIVYGATNTVEPSYPNSITYVSNSTNDYDIGTMKNYTRGVIYNVTIDENQPSLKWIGYVGEVSGSYALQDSDNFALYNWTIVTTRGEIYATKEGEGPDSSDSADEGGIPEWENMQCADAGNITQEEELFNHTIATGAKANEDSYTNTFTTDVSYDNFYVGDTKQILTTDTCYGVNLNLDGTPTGKNWTEIVLMDMTKESEPNSGYAPQQWDLVYMAKIQNNSVSYRGDVTYDFQMILPQSGLEGNRPNIGYYFYVELI